MAKNIIHILGASGSGTTTLGKSISEKWGYMQCDSDDYFWLPTNPPYTTIRESKERQRLLAADLLKSEKCVLTGSLCGWGDIFIPQFKLVIFVNTPTKIRIQRLKEREYKHFGDSILPGGDMYNNHIEFLEWAAGYDTAREGRSYVTHIEWLKKMPCPVVTVDGLSPLDYILKQLEERIHD